MPDHAVRLDPESQSLVRQHRLRYIARGRRVRKGLMDMVGLKINSATVTFGHNRHHLRGHSPGSALGPNMVERDCSSAYQAPCTLTVYGPFGHAFTRPHLELDRLLRRVHYRFDPSLLSRLVSK